MKFFVFQVRVSNSKVEKKNFTHRISNFKWIAVFFNFDLVTWKRKNKILLSSDLVIRSWSLTFELVSEIQYFTKSS